MPVLVALLRGINVGGRSSLEMSELRAVAEGLDYEDVTTYVQSGNLLLRSADPPDEVGRALEAALAQRGGVAPAVVVRTRDQLVQVVGGSPFLPGADPGHLHVIFTNEAEAWVDLEDVERYAPERVEAVGPDLHLLLPGGVGRSALARDLARRRPGAGGTMRSWKTVTKLLAMADELAGAEATAR
jgi:uncharacterized protein (DUF1697 family)